jgi:hypothetical protein
MSHKKRMREKKHLRKALRSRGACEVCAPMLSHPLREGVAMRGNIDCPKCGRDIAFDAESEGAVDQLMRCLFATGDFCEKGTRREVNGEVLSEEECGCDKLHFVHVGVSSPASEAAHGKR